MCIPPYERSSLPEFQSVATLLQQLERAEPAGHRDVQECCHWQLSLLWYIFMVGTMLPLVIPANACGTELLYQCAVLVGATIAAAMLLFTLKICVGAAEASAIDADHAAALAGDKGIDAKLDAMVEALTSNRSKRHFPSLGGMLNFAMTMCADEPGRAHHEAAAAAGVEGLRSVATKWKRVLLCGMLLLAVALSTTAAFLAIVIFEAKSQSRNSNAGYGLGSPFSMFMMVATTLWHGNFAWVAMCKY